MTLDSGVTTTGVMTSLHSEPGTEVRLVSELDARRSLTEICSVEVLREFE